MPNLCKLTGKGDPWRTWAFNTIYLGPALREEMDVEEIPVSQRLEMNVSEW